MSEILTRLTLPNSVSDGIMRWGRVGVSEMIKAAREHGADLKAEGSALLNAKDSDFQIDIVRGSVVERHVKTLQQSNAIGESPADPQKGSDEK